LLTIWSTDAAHKVYSALSPVLKGADFPIEVTDNFSSFPAGKMILALGTEALEAMRAAGHVPKNKGLQACRTQLFALGEQKLLLSYAPGIHTVDYARYQDLLCDTRLAIRVALTGKYDPPVGDYQYVDDFRVMIHDLEVFQKASGTKVIYLCHDTETVGKDPWFKGNAEIPPARFVTWQWSFQAGKSYIRYFKSKDDFNKFLDTGGMDQLDWLFTCPQLSHRLANGKYDLIWHYVHSRGVECTNFRFDSTLTGSLLDENRNNDLGTHAKIYSNIGGYSDGFDLNVDKNRMDLVDPEKLRIYAGGDTDAGLQVAAGMVDEIKEEPKLARFYVNLLHPAARAFEVIERGGIFVDREAYKVLESDLIVTMKECTTKAKKALGMLATKYRDLKKPGEINLTHPTMLREFLFSPNWCGIHPTKWTPKTIDRAKEVGCDPEDLPADERVPSTALDAVLEHKDHPKAQEFLSVLEEYQEADSCHTRYVISFLEDLRSDGKFHPSYFLHNGNRYEKDDGGTDTGRTSAKGPAIQTVPKHTKWASRLRKVFIAPPGFVMLERDFDQGELKVVACIANELVMLQIFRDGKDIHADTAADIVGMTYDALMALEKTDKKLFKKLRQNGKPANFGLLYGQFAKGFRNYAEKSYGVKMTLDEAERVRDLWFTKYPGISKYHENVKDFVHRYGYVESPLGRKRRLPLINAPDKWIRLAQERKAINSKVQSTLSDLMLMALAEEWAQGGFKVAPTFAMIHDAAYDYVPEDKVEQIAKQKKECMENLPLEKKFGWKPQIPFTASLSVGKNMAELEKLVV
jgi:DNA polymerase I-like protein with 3'-5' exonuclease and polymerase domains